MRRQKQFVPSFSLALAALGLALAVGPGADPAFSREKRVASSSRSSTEVRAHAGTPTRASSHRGGAAVTRSGYRGSQRSHSGHHRGHTHRSYGVHLGYYGHGGYYGYGGYYYGPYYHHYYYPYYPVFPTLYYGPYPAVYGDYRLGGVDLNVKPKKTEVWVDGQYVGRSGKLDGFPGYLWLEKGSHELIFYKPGYETSVHKIRILEGVVLRFDLDLEPGKETSPQELTTYRAEQQVTLSQEQDPRPRVDEEESGQKPRGRDVRPEPGRLLLEIEPGDASVYLDGRFLGTSRELSRLHAGLIVEQGGHTLEVVRPGYESERVEFSIAPGEETRVEVELTRG